MLTTSQTEIIATYNEGEFLHWECDETAQVFEDDYAEAIAAYHDNRLAGGSWQGEPRWSEFLRDYDSDLYERVAIRYTIHEQEAYELESLVAYSMQNVVETIRRHELTLDVLGSFWSVQEGIESWLYDNLDGVVACGACGGQIS